MSTDAPSQQAVLAADEAPDDPPAAPPAGGSRRRRVRRRWLVAAAVTAAGLVWLGWGSPATLVEHVVVEAPRGVSAESIRLASGISAADHVPAVDADAVRAAIMAAIPAVADVQVQRSLPHTIRLEVTARSPLAAVQSGKGFLVLDADGVVYDKVGNARKLPVIRARTDQGRETARLVLLSLPPDLRADVRRVAASTAQDVTLTLKGGATVRWGNPDRAELKARVLAGLVAVKADVYDVSSPLQPTTTGGRTAEEQSTP